VSVESPLIALARQWLDEREGRTDETAAHTTASLVALLESVVASTREEDGRRIGQLEARVTSLSVTLNWIKHELLLRDSNIVDRIDKAVKT